MVSLKHAWTDVNAHNYCKVDGKWTCLWTESDSQIEEKDYWQESANLIFYESSVGVGYFQDKKYNYHGAHHFICYFSYNADQVSIVRHNWNKTNIVYVFGGNKSDKNAKKLSYEINGDHLESVFVFLP